MFHISKTNYCCIEIENIEHAIDEQPAICKEVVQNRSDHIQYLVVYEPCQ